MSRMTTSCASFSWARPAIRRACSSDVKGANRSLAGALAVSVQAPRLDQLGDAGRNDVLDRLSAAHPIPEVLRRDRQRFDLEELHAFGMHQPLENMFEPVMRKAGPRRHRQSGSRDDGIRVLPRQEVPELVGTDEEDRVAPAAGLQHVYGALVRIELHLVAGKRGACELEPGVGVELYVFVPRPRGDQHDDLVAELLIRGVRQRHVPVVRRIEGAAEQGRHWNSSTSPSSSTSSPLRAPAAWSAAASSSSSFGTAPVMRNPRSVRRTRKRRPPGRGRYTRKSTRPSSAMSGGACGGQSSNSVRFSSSMPAPVAHETRNTRTIRGSSTSNGGASARRSILFSTTACGRV